MTKHIIKFVSQSIFYFFASLFMSFIGLFVVAYGVQKPRSYAHTTKPFTDPTQLAGNWMLVRLSHDWMLWWDNVYDGLLGDKRGYWNTYCVNNYKKNAWGKYCMWQWTAIRNSCNYFDRNIIGIDMSKHKVTLLAGQPIAEEDNWGWHFLLATNKETGKQRYYFGWFKEITKTHHAYIRVGWKIKLSHNLVDEFSEETDKWKGFVCRFSPWKST